MAKRTVRQAMAESAQSAGASQSLAEAAHVFKRADVRSVPVVDEGRLIGTLTERDIVTRAVAEGRDPRHVKVAEVASAEPVAVEAEQDLDEAFALMARHHVRRLPVVEAGFLVGTLAYCDVAEQDEGEVYYLSGYGYTA